MYLGGLLLKGGERQGRGGREFVVCPWNKKEKSAPVVINKIFKNK